MPDAMCAVNPKRARILGIRPSYHAHGKLPILPLIQTSVAELWIADHRRTKNETASVVIHGAGGSHLSHSKELRQSRIVNPVCVDLAGHGKSPGKGHTSIGDYAIEVVALMNALSIDSARIIGHSMGGAIAQGLALEHADRVSGLVLIATGARLRVNPQLIKSVVNDREATIENLNRWMWSKNAPAQTREQSLKIMRQMEPEVIAGDFLACDRFDIRERLGDIDCPTLIVAGENDKMTPVGLSQELADRIAASELMIVPGGSHMTMLEDSETVVAAIENWIERQS